MDRGVIADTSPIIPGDVARQVRQPGAGLGLLGRETPERCGGKREEAKATEDEALDLSGDELVVRAERRAETAEPKLRAVLGHRAREAAAYVGVGSDHVG